MTKAGTLILRSGSGFANLIKTGCHYSIRPYWMMNLGYDFIVLYKQNLTTIEIRYTEKDSFGQIWTLTAIKIVLLNTINCPSKSRSVQICIPVLALSGPQSFFKSYIGQAFWLARLLSRHHETLLFP